MQHLVNGFSSYTPVVLSIHHPLDLVGRNYFGCRDHFCIIAILTDCLQFSHLYFSSRIFTLFDCFRISLVLVLFTIWKSDVTHGSKHDLLFGRVLRVVCCSFRSFEHRVVILVIATEVLLLELKSAKVGCHIANLFLLLILDIKFLNFIQLSLFNVVLNARLVLVPTSLILLLYFSHLPQSFACRVNVILNYHLFKYLCFELSI